MMLSHFDEEIRETLSKSGRTFGEGRFGDIAVFTENGRDFSVIAVPISERTLEDAARKQLAVKRLSESYPGAVIIPEDRWRNSGKAYRARLMAHTGQFRHVFARNCDVVRIDKLTAASFLSDHHSYGFASAKYFYGMTLRRSTGAAESSNRLKPGTLVAVAEFSSPRKWSKDGKIIRSYEWVRYASMSGVRVEGGMGKVMAAFIDEIHPDDIMSYADLEWSDGSVYRTLGFEAESLRDPVDFTIDPHTWLRTPISSQRASSSIPSASASGSMVPPLRRNSVRDHTPCAPAEGMVEKNPADTVLYYRNMGSLKYRLKLTDY